MPTLRDIAIRWYRKVFGAPAGSDIRDEGLSTVLDGNSAVALAEASIASHAVLGGSFPSTEAESVWRGEIDHGNSNLYGEPLAAQSADGPRGMVAAATGLALAGRRATAFLSGPDIAAAQDLMISAAGKHAPLVLHLGTRALASHGGALGSGHEAVHLCADSGFFILFASNVQEAIDFTYISRRAAEETLVPGLVIMDGEQTALAAQDARLPSPAQVAALLGPARQRIDAPTAAQKLLFGETRRQVPAWHDLDEPVLSGALFEPDSFALGAFARRPFFDAFVDESLASAFEQFAAKTGRRHAPVSSYRLDDAETVLVAQGAAIETARAAADFLHERHKRRVGVLGIHSLRPFPGRLIAKALDGRDQVLVLERADAPLSGEPPLTREIRAAAAARSTCYPVIYGVGGLPLRVADLVALCTGDATADTAPRYLGVSFDDRSGEQPKREVLLDTLRRAYPDLANRGIRAAAEAEPAARSGELTIAIERVANGDGEGIAAAAGALLHALEEGHVRSRPAISWGGWSQRCVDRVTHGGDRLHDPGDGLVANVTLDVTAGSVLLAGESRRFNVPPDDGNVDASMRTESLLGGLFGALLEAGLIDQKARRVIGARRSQLENLPAELRDSRIAAFQAGMDGVAESKEADTGPADSATLRRERETPAIVRHLRRDDDHVASLPRFWDQVGVMWRDGRQKQLTPDPFFASGTMPPLSSTFRDFSDARDAMPAFDPTLCTGCGHCWTQCPDSAIGVVAATPAALIDAGITLSGADAVRQVASKLASRIISASKSGDAGPTTFGPMLDDAFSWLEGKMPLDENRKQAITEGLSGIRAQFGQLPVAVTQPFFHGAEAEKKDSAELLSIVINPDACKACGICISSCEPNALSLEPQDAARIDEAQTLWSHWSATPDTASETIERVAKNPDIGGLAALLLSRYCQFAVAGGDGAEPGSGEKTAVRLLLAATEFQQQPLVQRFAASLEETGDAISSLLHETLSGTLKMDDLDAISDQLKATSSPRVDARTLSATAGTSGDSHSIDTNQLLRLIELSKDIKAAHDRLLQGKHGLGRARYGLAIAGGRTTTWAGAFPQNPFQAPVLIDMSGDAAQLAAGLVEAHLRETTELARLLRLARLEIDKPDGADWQREALASLRWQDLSDDEYALCPPLIMIGSEETLAGSGLGQLTWLLNSRLPVKVLVLQSLDFGIAGGSVHESAQSPVNNPRASLALLALAQRNAYVAQTSIADAAHFGDSVLDGLRHIGPALIQVYAPSPAAHGFASDLSVQQAALAVRSRVLPLYRYNPSTDGVFGSRISLAGNPQPAQLLVADDDQERPLTPADWAMAQQRFRNAFAPLAADAKAPVPLHEWLELTVPERARKTPYLAAGSGDGEQRFSMSPALIDTVVNCLDVWRTLQELSGIVTPFTERLEKEIREEVAAEHRAQLNEQKRAAEAEINAIREKTEAEIASKIRSRLLALASRKRGGRE
ncbi:MAG: 4Fe-4S binding protein [Gammaproteobacteria bacterium]|nr:4Fe-4S binding protein [Gammaproteobacteria bacterium]